MITYQQFSEVKIVTGTIVKAEEFPKAKNPSYKVWADFGPEIGVLQTSAQITVHYTPETLIGKQILGCVNLGTKNIAGFISQFLLLGFSDKDGAIILAQPEKNIPNGAQLH